jgi:4-amino-4-deoxy-L-arabinose transferase-like glycosyltransferase
MMNDNLQKDDSKGRLRMLFDGSEHYALAILLLVVSCGTAFILYHIDAHAFLYFGDAASHIAKAREFIDSQRPGFENIGTVWLPLPHLLLIPFVSIDSLFYSGIAGLFVGIPCLVGTSVLLFLIIRRIIDSSAIAFLSACLLGLNPNVVYMALTPMSEPSLFFFVTLSGYGFLRWLQSHGERWLVVSALAVMLASLCRYDAWLLVPFVSIVAAYNGISSWTKQRKVAALRSFAISGICWAGIAFWLGWNRIQYGDALEFAHRTFSLGQSGLNNSPYYASQGLFLILGRAVLTVFGPLILFMSAFVFVRFRSLLVERIQLSLLVFFILPLVFTLAALLLGFVQIDRWGWNWRYVLTFGLFLSLASAIGLKEFFSRVRSRSGRSLIVISLFMIFLFQIAVPILGVATFDEARKSFNYGPKDAVVLGEELRSIYDKGSVALLTGYGQGQRIMISSRLRLRTFHFIGNSKEQSILGSLEKSERYLVIGKDRTPESQQPVDYWLARRELLLDFYKVRLENIHYVLMERR